MKNDMLDKITKIFKRIQCWIDNDIYRDSLAKTISEEFQHKIFCELDAILKKERYCFQKGKILLPTRYSIFISEADNIEWYGNKRQALEHALNSYLNCFIHPIAKENTLMPHGFLISIQPDRNLQKGEIKVTPYWENQNFKIEVSVKSQLNEKNLLSSNFYNEITQMLPTNYSSNYNKQDEDETVINGNSSKLFDLEIYRDGIFLQKIPIFNPTLKIGRGSEYTKVDIPLKEDPEISRLHAIFTKNEEGNYQIIAKGKNPIFINDEILYKGQIKELVADENIKIGFYSLQFRG